MSIILKHVRKFLSLSLPILRLFNELIFRIMEEILSHFDRTSKHDAEYAEKIRKKYLTHSLTANQRIELYNAAVNGQVDDLKKLVDEKKYPLMEECSADGYYWTVIHYAAHYGFINIISYVLEYYQDHPNRVEILNMQSNLGMSPLFVAICNTASIEKKKQAIDLYIKYDVIDFKVCSKQNQDIFEICKLHNLLEYFLSMLKED